MQEVRVWRLTVLLLGHCAFSARIRDKAFPLSFYKMDTMKMQLGLELHINNETTSNPTGTF